MSYKYTDSYIEKNFLYLFALSILLHLAVAVLFHYLPEKKKVAKEEPIMIDLQDLPSGKEAPASAKKEVKRFAEQKHRVAKEMAPKGEMERERIASLPRRITPPIAQPQPGGRETAPWRPTERGQGPTSRETQPGEDLLVRRQPEPTNLARLFPRADRMARLEENYRKKYGPEVEEGDTKFLDSDDIQFGSFLRRFETAVYGVWNYPEEAARQGIEGMTPVRITFNRKGEIEKVDVLESSGSSILDNEVLRTLHHIGPVGSLPKGYTKDKFYLIAFFQYGIYRGMSRSLH